MTEARLPDRGPDQSTEGKKTARVTHIKSRGFTPKPPDVVISGPLQPTKIDGIILESTDETKDGVNTGFLPQSPEPALTHKGGMSKGAKIGSATAAGALAVAGGVFVANEAGIFDSESNSEAKVQIVPAQEQPTNIPGTEIPNPLKTPESTVNAVAPTVAPTATPTEIKPTATPTVNKESVLPPEAQQLITSLDNITVLTKEQKDAVKAGFSRDWDLVANETSDVKKIAPYLGLYSSLKANYNVTRDSQERELMNQIEDMIRVKFPRIYASIKDGGTFISPDAK